MLFMVIERFWNRDPAPVGTRFQEKGRLMPEGVEFVDSWIDADEMKCFQIMKAPDKSHLDEWIANWSDIVDFEVIPVMTSAQFWAARPVT